MPIDRSRRPFVIFYSWQSDLPAAINRNFIEAALERAARTIQSDDSIAIEPVIDRDTVGVPGSPNIAATIFEKIERADAIIADVSIVSDDSSRRPTSNPNVLLELGYAIKAKGWRRILTVMNTAFGNPEILAFDLRGQRVITFAASSDPIDSSPVGDALVADFEAAIRGLLHGVSSHVGQEIQPASVATLAIEAIEAERPSRTNLTRRFVADATSRLVEIAPDLHKPQYDRDLPSSSLASTTPVVAEFAKVAAAAATMDDNDAAEELMRDLQPVLDRCYLPAGFSGNYWNHQFDFFRFLAWWLLLVLVGSLLRERRWGTLSRVLTARLYLQHSFFAKGPDHVGLEYFNLDIQTLTGRAVTSEAGDVLHQLVTASTVHEAITFEELQAADYLIFLRLDLAPAEAPTWPLWYGRAAVLLARPPQFIIDALNIQHASHLASALGLTGVDLFRERMKERGRRFLAYYAPFVHRINVFGTFASFDFDDIGMHH